jgi:hypothetical protein
MVANASNISKVIPITDNKKNINLKTQNNLKPTLQNTIQLKKPINTTNNLKDNSTLNNSKKENIKTDNLEAKPVQMFKKDPIKGFQNGRFMQTELNE